MTHALRSRIALLTLCLAACGGGATNSNANSNANANANGATSGSEQTQAVVAQDDVSEVAAPNELVALVRATSVRAVASRIARFGFLSEAQANGMASEILSQFLGNEALSRVVRTERPMDGAVVLAGGRWAFVVSFAVPTPSETVRRVGNGYRSRSVGNGVIELTLQRDEQQSGPRDPEDDIEREENVCFVSPTPSPAEGRLTCTTGARSALELVTPFLARTLTRRDSRQDAIVATVFPNAVRAMAGSDVNRGFDELDRSVDRELGSSANQGLLRHADLRQALLRFAQDVTGNLRSLWTETHGIDLAVTFDDQRVRLVGSVDLHNPTGSYARGLIEGSRAAPAMPEQFLQRIPSDVGMVITGGFGQQLAAPFARPINDIVTALARSEARLPAPLVTQLQGVITHMFDHSASVAAGVGADAQGQLGSISISRFNDPTHATQFVADYRQTVTILRNPAFSRAVDTFMRQMDVPRVNIDWRQVRELPATGLPAGSFVFQTPDFQAIARQVNETPARPPTGPRPRAARPAAVPVHQYLVVPEGAYVTIVHGRDVRAQWAQVAARTGPAIDLAAHGARPGAFAMAIIPAGFPSLMAGSGAPDAARTAATTRTFINRMPDRGATPAIFRMSNAEVDGNQRFSLEIEVQASTLTGLAAAMR
jgi:hypothetical protein